MAYNQADITKLRFQRERPLDAKVLCQALDALETTWSLRSVHRATLLREDSTPHRVVRQ